MKIKNLFLGAVLLLFCNLIIVQWSTAQNGSWTEKQYVPVQSGGLDSGCSFSIGDKGYIVTGVGADWIGSSNLWEYDKETDTWLAKADFPGVLRTQAVAFTIGSKAYVGTGASVEGSIELDDFWEWDQLTDTWTQKANFGGSARRHAAGFSVDGKGYIGTGATPGMSWIFYADFWEYDPNTDSWTQKADFPSMRYAAAGFSIENKGYICSGGNSEPNLLYPNDLQEYDPASDTWTAKAEIPSTMGLIGSGRDYAAYFCIGSKVYIGTGGYLELGQWLPYYANDFWEWDQNTDEWTDLGVFGGPYDGYRQWAVGFAIGNVGYLGTGEWSGVSFNDLWEYDVQTGVETIDDNSSITVYPNPATDFVTIKTDESIKGSTCFISDQLGRTILTFELTEESSKIDISDFPVGLYIVSIGNKTYKLLKK